MSLTKAKRMNIALLRISHNIEEIAEIVGCCTNTVRTALKSPDVMTWGEELLETRRQAMHEVLVAVTREEMLSPDHPNIAELIEAKIAELDNEYADGG